MLLNFSIKAVILKQERSISDFELTKIDSSWGVNNSKFLVIQ